MQKKIYIIGLISLALFLIATFFKAAHWPGSGILILVGLGTISFVFLPIGYSKAIKSTKDKLLRFVYTAAFISFFLDFIGMAFKILHWPGAGILLIIGVPLPFILFLPAYIRYHNKRKLKTDINFFAVVFFMVYLGIFSSLLAIDVSRNILGAYANSANNIAATNLYLEKNIKSKNEAEELLNLLDKIKQELVSIGNAKSGQVNTIDGHVDYRGIGWKSVQLPYRVLAEIGLDSFNKQFDIYCQKVEQTKINKRLITEINTFRLGENKNIAPIIGKLPLIGILSVLTDWQNKILLIEHISNS